MHSPEKRLPSFAIVALAYRDALPLKARRGAALCSGPDLPRTHQRLVALQEQLKGAPQFPQRPEFVPRSGRESRLRNKCNPLRSVKDYCLHCSIHGLRYIAEDGLHWIERVVWVMLCMIAVFGAGFMANEVTNRYWNSPTMTVVESTTFPIADIPFPAVTLCENNRVRWSRALRYQQRHLSEVSAEASRAFLILAQAMNSMAFGDFDRIPDEFPTDQKVLAELRHLNLTAFMLEVMTDCRQFFEGECWWRNADIDCCDIFELQRTDSGFCYSFNSEISEERKETLSQGRPLLRPRRTSNKGSWSGLRVAVKCSLDLPPGSMASGITVTVNSPLSMPSDGASVAAGQWASVSVTAQDTYTTDRLRQLEPKHRGCLYRDEAHALDIASYDHVNCLHACQRSRVAQLCGCSPYHYPLPASGNYSSCNVEGMLCLKKYNDIFNYVKPRPGNPYFEGDREGMECDCLPNCDSQTFSTALYIAPLGSGFLPAAQKTENFSTTVFLDVHFEGLFVVRYRTDLVFGWLDLIVSLGGIVGLFLGSSMLSAAELVYYATLRPWSRLWREAHYEGRQGHRNRVDECSSTASSAHSSGVRGVAPAAASTASTATWARPLAGISPPDSWLH